MLLGAAPALDQSLMTAMMARHQFGNDARLAVAARAENDSFVLPIHGRQIAPKCRELKSNLRFDMVKTIALTPCFIAFSLNA